MGRPRRAFTREFKQEAVKLVTESTHSTAQVARDLGLRPNLLRRWKQEIAGDPVTAFPGKGRRKPHEEELTASRSRRGNCWDNAVVESFFHTLKTELVHHRRCRTREDATQDIFEWIEVFYNRVRRHSTLGYRSPAEFDAAAGTLN